MYKIWDGELPETELIKDLIQEGTCLKISRIFEVENFHDVGFWIILVILFTEVKEGNLFLFI